MAKEFFTIDDFDLADKTVMLRVDINSPINPETGELLGDMRLREVAPTIKRLGNTRLVIIAHQSRPGAKDFVSLSAHAKRLSTIIGKKVRFIDDLFSQRAQDAIKRLRRGQVLMLENVRFYAEEIALAGAKQEDQARSNLVSNLAPLLDYYVIDAFATAHRDQPSLTGFIGAVPSMAGLLIEKEIKALDQVLKKPKHPSIAILGGIKIDDSLKVAENMLKNGTIEQLLTTGAIGNIFIAAQGADLGKVNVDFLKQQVKDYEAELKKAKALLKKYKDKIMVPTDLAINHSGYRVRIYIKDLPTDYPIYDIGLGTIVNYFKTISEAKTITANGPAGVFELEEFSYGTFEIFKAMAEAKAFSVLGGGETTMAIDRLGIKGEINHISTGGGACIIYLGGQKLEVIEALKEAKKKYKNGFFKDRK
jgi:phosphoglycerate kinase